MNAAILLKACSLQASNDYVGCIVWQWRLAPFYSVSAVFLARHGSYLSVAFGRTRQKGMLADVVTTKKWKVLSIAFSFRDLCMYVFPACPAYKRAFRWSLLQASTSPISVSPCLSMEIGPTCHCLEACAG